MNKNSYHLGKNSDTDWLIIVGVFVALSAVFVGLAFYQFSNYRKNDKVFSRTTTATSTVPILDRVKLDSVVKYLADREQKFKALKATPLRFADPSK